MIGHCLRDEPRYRRPLILSDSIGPSTVKLQSVLRSAAVQRLCYQQSMLYVLGCVALRCA